MQGGARQGSERPAVDPVVLAHPTPPNFPLSPSLFTTQFSFCLEILQGPPVASVALFKGKKNKNRLGSYAQSLSRSLAVVSIMAGFRSCLQRAPGAGVPCDPSRL